MKNQSSLLSKIIFLLVTVLLISACNKELFIEDADPDSYGKRVLRINNADGFVDTVEMTILFTIRADSIGSYSAYIHFYDYLSIQFCGQELINNQVNDLGNIEVNHSYQLIASNENRLDTFQLIFTRIPMMHIITEEKIVDEPKVLATISIQYCDTLDALNSSSIFNSFGGIEIRGATSTRYDKKSYGLELWTNNLGEEYSKSLLEMRECEDWILDAMYIDDLRMRNRISFELWEKMNSTLLSDTWPQVFPGIHCRYLELFINNRYQGIYTLNEKLDDRLLQFSIYQDEEGGVLYKANQWGDGATTFYTYDSKPPNDYVWDGWEQIFPKYKPDWIPLALLREIIVEKNDDDFKKEIVSHLDIDNAMNYFLFINLLLASDNAGKNTYLCRYTNESPFIIIPWDIEASWGLFWDRSKIKPQGIVMNHLFERLIETNAADFNGRIRNIWFEYRNNFFSEEALLSPIREYYNLVNISGTIDRENSRWDEIAIDIESEQEYIINWIQERLQYLDAYFGSP